MLKGSKVTVLIDAVAWVVMRFCIRERAQKSEQSAGR